MSDEVSPITGRRYERPHVELRGPGERLPAWTCQCKRPDGRRLLRNYRHTSEMQCIPQAEIDAWRVTSGCGPETAREMYWLFREFSREGARA